MRTFNTMNVGYFIHSVAAFTLMHMWNVKLVEIRSDYGHLLFYRGD